MLEDVMQYKKVALKQYPQLAERISAENRFWISFKKVETTPHNAKVTCIDFSPIEPYDIAATSSTHVSIYDGRTLAPKKQFSRFRDVAFSGRYRGDGKLLVAGTGNAYIKIFEVESRAMLREMRGHNDAIHVANFTTDGNHVFTASDDSTVRLWDIATAKHTAVFQGHKDFVRCAVQGGTFLSGGASERMLISGSYDHTVKVWDERTQKSTMNFDHGAPVEAITTLKGGNLLVTAGSNYIRLWDMLGRIVHTLNNHQKTITCLAVDSTGTRLVSGALDHQVKFYDLESLQVTHSIKATGPVLSCGISPSNSVLAIGLLDGSVNLSKREVSYQQAALEKKEERILRAGNHRYFTRGQSLRASDGDFTVESSRKQRLQPYDRFLKRFQYRAALDAALETGHHLVVTSVLDELIQRNALNVALGGRNDVSLAPILHFLVKQVTNPRYSSLLIDVSNAILDIYAHVIGESVTTTELFLRLRQKLQQEVSTQEDLFQFLGAIDLVVGASSVVNAPEILPIQETTVEN